MMTFNDVGQLSQAHLPNGCTVRILEPVSLMATTVPTGRGIRLASGNIARVDFDILESTLGRQVSYVSVGGIIEKALRNSSGEWEAIVSPLDPEVSISMAYLDGQIWTPDTPNSTGSPYSITSWVKPDEDTLQITTRDNSGTIVVLVYSKYRGIVDELEDLSQRVSYLEAYNT